MDFWGCNQPSFKAGKELKMSFLIILIPLLVLNRFPHMDFCRSHSSSPEAKSFTSFWGSIVPWCQRPTTPPSGAGRAASRLCSDPLSQPSLELSTESKSSLPLIHSFTHPLIRSSQQRKDSYGGTNFDTQWLFHSAAFIIFKHLHQILWPQSH